jgi:phosphate transport system substrate-binding protein
MRLHHRQLIWMSISLGLILAGLGSGCGGKQHILTVAGSTAFHAAAVELANRYSEIHPEVTVSVQDIGSAAGREAVLADTANIGTVDASSEGGMPTGLVGTVVAWDAIAVVVHPDNPVIGLSAAQVRDIFAGRINNWAEVGGRDHAINRILREQGSGTRSIFEERLGLGESEGNVVIADSSGAVREMVANDVHAIGYISRGSLTPRVRSVSINGERCSDDRIATQQYPLAHPILMVTREVPPAKAGDFILFALSNPGREVVRQGGFVAP